MSGGFINDRYNKLHKPEGRVSGRAMALLALILFLALAFAAAEALSR